MYEMLLWCCIQYTSDVFVASRATWDLFEVVNIADEGLHILTYARQ